MEVGVQRADRLQANGPRVSFNRDVHVKRIGTRPNEKDNYPIQTTNLLPPQNPNLRRELPSKLSEESILKEAARVLAQAERIRCTAEGGSDIVGGKLNEKTRGRIQRRELTNPNYFHSLPTRKKNTKPISRSVSDVSSKKPKKPSIFNIFSRKSDTNLDQLDEDLKPKEKENSSKRLARSKSDVEPSKERKKTRKRNNSENDDNLNIVKPAQLSPIIENSQREDYFTEDLEDKKDKDKNLDKDKKEDDDEKVKPDIEKVESEIINKRPSLDLSDTRKDSPDLDTLTPITENLKDVISSLTNHSKSLEDMHSSQLPPEKPPLTKGVTVDGMVKRLSMERFSPPPHITGPAFSYTRPNDQVIYAQVVCDSEYKGKPYTLNNNNNNEGNKNMEGMYHRYDPNDYNNHRNVIEDHHHHQNHHQMNGLKRSDYPSHKSGVYINGDYDSRYRSYSPQPIPKPRGNSSPNHWKRSPRNLSDEDEGLGFEPRKYFEEEIQASTPIKVRDNRYTAEYEKRRSPTEEPPIVPIIRSLSPVDIRLDSTSRGKADGMDTRRRETFIEKNREFNTLSHRRELLESKIKSRRFASLEPTEQRKTEYFSSSHHSPERKREYSYDHSPELISRDLVDSSPGRYLSPERESSQKYHKLNSNEILNKYSPERTHLDMISPSRDVKTSSYKKTKCYDDGSGGVREIYKRETVIDEYGQPHVRESRHRERLESPRRSSRDPETDYSQDQIEEKYRHEYEPKSLDSQFSEMNRSSPENIKRTDGTGRKYDDHWQDSLKRDKRHQRSFDKGDSGIENDFRKESFNGEFSSKWRKRTFRDDIKSCEMFIRKERRHTEELHPQRKKYDIVYRERSIDDGSHFDPRLDKYPKEVIRKSRDRMEAYSSPLGDGTGTIKREKKKGGLEKMKQLFSGSSKKKETKETKDIKETKEMNGKAEPGKDHYMVREEEMRLRYHEYKGVVVDLREPKIPDIATRRRLSTPKASPVPTRMPSEKILRPSPLASKEEPTFVKAEKSGWFKSLDRISRKKSMKGERPALTAVPIDDDINEVKTGKSYQTPPQMHSKSLRFFGDTDQESNPSLSKSASKQKARPAVMTIERQQKYSQSAYHLDRIPKPGTDKQKTRSSSLQNLEDGVDEVDRPKQRRHHSRSRNLDNISESGSDTDIRKEVRQPSVQKVSPRENRENESHSSYHNRKYYDEEIHHRSQERESRSPLREHNDTARIEFRKPPPGPPKPARSMERRTAYSRERERLHDSSGTEGDSSLQSQRSVVYLHATTVGAIPQPYQVNSRRRAMSREELSAKSKEKQLEPMTRTVSRSVSMLAPWKPKHLHEGYEINYSQEGIEKPNKKHSTMPRKPASGSSSKTKRSSSSTNTAPRNRKTSSKDDLSSIRNSSTTSASKSGISSAKKSSEPNRKDTLSRRRVK